MNAVREELNLHLSLQPDVTDGMRPPLNLLLTSYDADCLDASFFFQNLASYMVSLTICHFYKISQPTVLGTETPEIAGAKTFCGDKMSTLKLVVK